jgi:hypothetical protein
MLKPSNKFIFLFIHIFCRDTIFVLENLNRMKMSMSQALIKLHKFSRLKEIFTIFVDIKN